MSISKRAHNLEQKPSSIVVGHMKCAEDPFSEDNQTGYLNFGIAENHLMNDLLLKKLNENIKVSQEHIHYSGVFGMPSFQERIKNLFETNLGLKDINPENIVIQSGVSSICEALSFALFDEGDYIMIPTPYYTGFDHDFTKRFEAKFLKTHLKSEDNFKHDIEIFKKTYAEFENKEKIKAILITHPHNPTGEVLSEKFIFDIVEFAKENNLEIISDEIYALSNHCGQEHQSLYQYATENGAKAHLLYGMAKDFAIAGFKVGFFYSEDQQLVNAMKGLTYFHPVSSITQEIVSHLLTDSFFLNQFIDLNQQRLNKTKREIMNSLTHLKFIDYDAGLFMLLDLSDRCESFADEDQIFNKLLNEFKINFSKGQDQGMNKPGYFRVCFARDNAHIKELTRRLQEFK